jgi:hypothetical protein
VIEAAKKCPLPEDVTICTGRRQRVTRNKNSGHVRQTSPTQDVELTIKLAEMRHVIDLKTHNYHAFKPDNGKVKLIEGY